MKKTEGFTLIEITISIAMLAFISVVVLKLFLAANVVNNSSMITDTATLLVTNDLEKISTMDSTSELDDDFIKNDGNFSKEVYLNKDFQISESDLAYQVQILLLKEKGGLYEISAYFYELNDKNTKKIVEINTYHFFKNEEKRGQDEQ